MCPLPTINLKIKFMIRKDVIEKLKNEELDKLFLPYRPKLDQPGYRIGKIGEEWLVMNESTKEIMDFFYDDDLGKIWFDIKLLPKFKYDDRIIEGIYFFNRNDHCLYRFEDGKYKKLSGRINHDGYKCHNPFRVNLPEHFYIYLFKPNPYPEDVITKVDHIDRNRLNNEFTNLRIVDSSTNSKNSDRSKHLDSVYYCYVDKAKTVLVKTFSNKEELQRTYPGKDIIKLVSNAIHYNCKTQGYYWSKELISLKDYLENIGYDGDIDQEKFIYNSYFDISVNTELGLFKTTKNNITPGSKGGRYYSIETGSSRFKGYAHVLLYMITNGLTSLEESIEIGHKNADGYDNRIENLEPVTHTENMENQITRERLSESHLQPVKDELSNEFKSVKECAEFYKVSQSTITRWIKKGKIIKIDKKQD